MRTSRPLFALLIGASCALADAAVPTWPVVELQARTNLLVNDNGWNLPPGSSFNSISASINNDARVSFTVGVVPDAGGSHPGLWTGAHGSGVLVYEGPTDSGISSEAPINADGRIVFTMRDTGSMDGLYLYNPVIGSASRINTLPVLPNSYSSPDINTAGAIGYQAVYASGRAYASTLGANSVLHAADAAVSPGSPYTYLYTPAFDDQRRIVAKVSTSADFTTKQEIRRFGADGSSTLVLANQATDAASPWSGFDNGLAVNADGVVAVVARRAADNRRVVLRSDGTTTTLIAEVDPAGTIRDIDFFAPAINAAGLVVFRARDAVGQAIYAGDGEALVRVVGQSSAVQTDLGAAQIGQHDSSPIFAGKPDVNDRGDIAFVAGLHPSGNNQVEWGSGVFVAYAAGDAIFADGFELP
ncbi:MAG: hypothetical protein J0L88_03295 [Xanthomonadales bacterium]|nr:hypothetical protein [Xanthomonadales bacterium]